jgi:uncharacterized membrane protein YgcG
MILIATICSILLQTAPNPAQPGREGLRTVPTTMSAPARVFPPRVPVEKVIADFLAAVQASDAYDARAMTFVAESNQADGGDPGEFINQSLAVLSSDFKKGLDLVFDDKPAEAADVFEALSKSDDPFMSIAAASLAGTTFIELEQIERCHEMLLRVQTAHAPVENYTTSPEQFLFMLGYCQVHQLDYEAATRTLEEFLVRYPDAPERLRVSATQIMTELSSRAPGQIGDVRDLLEYARRRIGQGETGEPVVRRQQEAVALLDTLIEEAEQQEKGDGEGEGSGGGGGGGSPGGNNQPGSGANRSTAPGGQSREGELRKTRARPGESWGRMPPKERDQILQTLQKQFPSRYRDLLEQYYRQLSKDAGKS